MIAWKLIKPTRLKEQSMRLTMLNAMRQTGGKIKADFERTTETWEHKPKFEILISLTGPGPVLMVDTDDEIYRYVNDGTKPHPIFAGIYTGKSKKKVLAFKSQSYPKTFPGVIASVPGGAFGSDVRVPYVPHPGTKARKFDEAITRKWRKPFKREMEAAMRLAALRSGHAI